MTRRILVTLDGSPFGESALPAAVEVARKTGGELRLVTVHDAGWAMGQQELETIGRDRATTYLKEIQDRLREVVELEATSRARDGFVLEEVLAEAEEWGADLIVMSTHGRGPFKRLWLGGVADAVVRRARCPVLLVRPHGEEEPAWETRSWTPARIVVPLDGSSFAEMALDSALVLADRFGVPMELIRVVSRALPPASPLVPEAMALGQELLEEECAAADDYLGRTARWLRAWGTEPVRRVVVEDEIAGGILAQAGDDLVVMATHARRGLERAVMGSVTERVVREAAGPVLVVPPLARAEPEEEGAGEAATPSPTH